MLSISEISKTVDMYLFLFDDILLLTKVKKHPRKVRTLNTSSSEPLRKLRLVMFFRHREILATRHFGKTTPPVPSFSVSCSHGMFSREMYAKSWRPQTTSSSSAKWLPSSGFCFLPSCSRRSRRTPVVTRRSHDTPQRARSSLCTANQSHLTDSPFMTSDLWRRPQVRHVTSLMTSYFQVPRIIPRRLLLLKRITMGMRVIGVLFISLCFCFRLHDMQYFIVICMPHFSLCQFHFVEF